jgi:hypothetical protein
MLQLKNMHQSTLLLVSTHPARKHASINIAARKHALNENWLHSKNLAVTVA